MKKNGKIIKNYYTLEHEDMKKIENLLGISNIEKITVGRSCADGSNIDYWNVTTLEFEE